MKENIPNQKENKMNIMVFDTETTGLDKPFCYDIGYAILNERQEVLLRRHYVIEQTWHNLPLFESAYYKEKRPQYVALMRKREIIMDKWGYVMQQITRDIRKYEITDAYAYNSDFDDKVFTFNCDWYKCINPLEAIAIHDIWGYASQFITCNPDYKWFCEINELFTDSGNYKGSAESVYRFLTDNNDFNEAHMGAYDVDIESQILFSCIERGAEWNKNYKVVKILVRPSHSPYTIKVNGEIIHQGVYSKKYVKNGLYSFTEQGQECPFHIRCLTSKSKY